MKTIKKILILLGSFVIGSCCTMKFIVKPTIMELKKTRELSTKHLSMFLLMNKWVYIKQHSKSLSLFFYDNSYKRVAIYGMNYMGSTLVEELKSEKITVEYGIDRAQIIRNDNLKIISPDDFFNEVDVVIVTPISAYEEIADSISKKINCPIVSMDEVVLYCYEHCNY